jgi:hypothetical protein
MSTAISSSCVLVCSFLITSAGFTQAQNATSGFAPLSSFLTSYYTFNPDGFLLDSSDTRQNLNPSKSPPRPSTDCYIDNGCADFNSTLLNSFNITTRQYGSSMSFCLWFLAYTRATNPSTLLNFGGGVNINEMYLALAINDNIEFVIATASNQRSTFTTLTGLFALTSWHHICITKIIVASESSEAWSIYVNGTKYRRFTDYKISSSSIYPVLPESIPTTQNYIGQPITGTRTSQLRLSYFNGKIDEFRWYNTAITTPNVTALYQYYRYPILNTL